MGNRVRIVSLVAAAVVMLQPATGGAATTGERVAYAARYVVSQQAEDGSIHSETSFGSPITETADAVVSLVAARRGGAAVEQALDYLEANSAAIADTGEKAKVVLAAVAGGRDPRSFGGRNLVAEIVAGEQPDGRLGDNPTFTGVFNHSLALLALAAADASIERRWVVWLADAQCRNGGWQYDEPADADDNRRCHDGSEFDYSESDTNTTALAIQALTAVPRSVSLDTDPFRFLRAVRDDVKGGWGFNASYSLTDTVSTSMVLQAFAAGDVAPPKGSRRALRALQYRLCGRAGGAFSGGWAVDEATGDLKRTPRNFGGTVAAILGLLERPLPVRQASYLLPVPAAKPC